MTNYKVARCLALAAMLFTCGLDLSSAMGAENPVVQQLVRMYSKQASDPVEVAGLLMKAAKGVANDPALQRDLYAAAYERAMQKPDGAATAIEAATILLRLDREHQREWLAKSVDAYRVQYQRADGEAKAKAAGLFVDILLRAGRQALDNGNDHAEASKFFGEAKSLALRHKLDTAECIDWWTKVTALARRVDDRMRQMEARLKKNSNDATALNEQLRLLVTELDRPAEAAQLLRPGVTDATLSKLAPLAAADGATLQDDQLLELAGGYSALAGNATELGKPRLLVRSIDYFERWLAKHTDSDANRLTALAGLSMSRKQLRELKWYGWHGTIRAVGDDRFILRLNGEQVVSSSRNCQHCEARVVLKPGDVLMVRAWDVLPPSRSFELSFTDDDDQKLFEADATWRIASPADASQWWVFEPSDADPPCKVIRSPDRIWGTSKICYLYKIVTVEDLRPMRESSGH